MSELRTISVRIELRTSARLSDAAARALGQELAEVAARRLRQESTVGTIHHAASVLRKG